ncbi:MAG: polyprenyl synthetase family protein [Bacteroidia bacterium]
MALVTSSPATLRSLQESLPEWQVFEAFYERLLRTGVYRDNWLLAKLGGFLLRRGGKRLRPLLLLYIAKACGEITEATYVGACLIEILHNATLIHDDVVDDSEYRRGFFSVRALWGNRIAVLFGDWLLAQGLITALRYQQPQLLQYASEAVEALAEGELLQLKRMREANQQLDSYFKVIQKKTAALFQAACKMGAWSVGASEALIERAGAIGQELGIAFQIRDDLLDWQTTERTGKPVDADRRQKRFTLPLLWAFQQATPPQRKVLLHGSFRESKALLEAMGAFAYAEALIEAQTQKAQRLAEALPYAQNLPLAQLFHLLLKGSS